MKLDELIEQLKAMKLIHKSGNIDVYITLDQGFGKVRSANFSQLVKDGKENMIIDISNVE